jgi:hypothetical protein
MLAYQCPTTSRVVHSRASEADLRRLSVMRLSLWCPYCQIGHAIMGKDIQAIRMLTSPHARLAVCCGFAWSSWPMAVTAAQRFSQEMWVLSPSIPCHQRT